MISNFIVLCMPHNGKWTMMSLYDQCLTCAHSQDEIGFVKFWLGRTATTRQELQRQYLSFQLTLGQNIIANTSLSIHHCQYIVLLNT